MKIEMSIDKFCVDNKGSIVGGLDWINCGILEEFLIKLNDDEIKQDKHYFRIAK